MACSSEDIRCPVLNGFVLFSGLNFVWFLGFQSDLYQDADANNAVIRFFSASHANAGLSLRTGKEMKFGVVIGYRGISKDKDSCQKTVAKGFSCWCEYYASLRPEKYSPLEIYFLNNLTLALVQVISD